jgi:hypothetical protein
VRGRSEETGGGVCGTVARVSSEIQVDVVDCKSRAFIAGVLRPLILIGILVLAFPRDPPRWDQDSGPAQTISGGRSGD